MDPLGRMGPVERMCHRSMIALSRSARLVRSEHSVEDGKSDVRADVARQLSFRPCGESAANQLGEGRKQSTDRDDQDGVRRPDAPWPRIDRRGSSVHRNGEGTSEKSRSGSEECVADGVHDRAEDDGDAEPPPLPNRRPRMHMQRVALGSNERHSRRPSITVFGSRTIHEARESPGRHPCVS
jgi:hypothetical protein